MFLGERVKHVKFGEGVITDFVINSEDAYKSYVSVLFDDATFRNIAIEVFGTRYNGMMVSENTEVRPYVDKLEDESKLKKEIKIKNILNKWEIYSSKERVPVKCDLDETGKVVNLHGWSEVYKEVGKDRLPGEQRAVIMDNKIVFVNAGAAARFLGEDIQDAEKIYEVCGEDEKYCYHYFEYATREDIEEITNGNK